MFVLDDCIAFLTCREGKKLSKCLDKRLKPLHITRVQWIAIYYISQNEGISQNYLSELMSVKEASIALLLVRMEKEGFVLRKTSEKDKRINKIYLTKKGRILSEKAQPVFDEFKKDVTDGISEEELSSYKSVLYKMVKNAEK
ncbi:MAG: MarR family transcriptional regulator [Bacillales bacterium]|nr:MarR family transcriptional regulator [Bacillales bacterium]